MFYLGVFCCIIKKVALVAELVYAHGLGPCPAKVGGSSPLEGTLIMRTFFVRAFYFFNHFNNWLSKQNKCQNGK